MPIALVDSKDEAAWHRERDRRVTKTRATQLASNPGISTFKRLHAESGGSFKGNDATRRGHRLEPVVTAWVEAHVGIPASGVLYAHETNVMHAATPDCALEDEGEWLLVEIKTHKGDWSRGLPRKIILDALWQKYVMGASWAAVAHWQVDDKGQPLTIEPVLVEIDDDQVELQRMIDGADAYLAWVDAGCPDTDDESELPLEIVQAVEDYNRGKGAEQRIREFCADRPGFSKTLAVGGIAWANNPNADEFDKAAFLAANPAAAAKVAEVDRLLKAASPQFRKPKASTRLTITAPKETA